MLNIENTYEAYCLDEAVDTWGLFVHNEVNGLKRTRKESDEHYGNRQHRTLLTILGMEDQIQYRAPG